MNQWKLEVVDKYGSVWDVPVPPDKAAKTLKHLVDSGMPMENIRLIEAEAEPEPLPWQRRLENLEYQNRDHIIRIRESEQRVDDLLALLRRAGEKIL